MLGSAESEHLMLTNREIIFEEFQPMSSQSINVTDRRTDGQTTCDRKTALCTVGLVHRAVKTINNEEVESKTYNEYSYL